MGRDSRQRRRHHPHLGSRKEKDRLGGDWPILKNAIFDIGFTPDRKYVVVIDESGEVKVADVAKREVTTTVQAVKGGVNGSLPSRRRATSSPRSVPPAK